MTILVQPVIAGIPQTVFHIVENTNEHYLKLMEEFKIFTKSNIAVSFLRVGIVCNGQTFQEFHPENPLPWEGL